MAVHQTSHTAVQNCIHELVIITDSDYVQNGFVEHLMNTKTRGMLCANNKPLKHGKLIQSINDLAPSNEMTIYWKIIKGHSRIEGPDKAGDDLAEQLAKNRSRPWGSH
ncbi:ribonuclease H-like [Ambystoma mexicanum]|uniref:ribonuclease H-like n=1 Tax=Ambystoma mexicanum TaxID=8296 RepID=UPI0037E8BD0B